MTLCDFQGQIIKCIHLLLALSLWVFLSLEPNYHAVMKARNHLEGHL